MTAIFAPNDGSSLRLSQPEYQQKALQHLRYQMSGTFSPLHLLLILFMRLFMRLHLVRLLVGCPGRDQVQDSMREIVEKDQRFKTHTFLRLVLAGS